MPTDFRLWDIYGDWLHTKNGGHLSGGIADDATWRTWWGELAVIPVRRHDAPGGEVGSRFMRALSNDIGGVWPCRCNAECLIVFHIVIMQRARHVTTAQVLLLMIWKRLYTWDSEQHQILVEETDRTCEQYLSISFHY